MKKDPRVYLVQILERVQVQTVLAQIGSGRVAHENSRIGSARRAGGLGVLLSELSFRKGEEPGIQRRCSSNH